jgi:translocation and assembly module TamB
MEANIEVAFDKARVLNQRNMSAKATGNIKYVQEAGHAEVSGEATVNEAEYSLAAAPADDVIKLNVKELHRPPGLIELPEKPEPSDFVTRLKIDIRAQNQLFVRGRGLDSEWSGRLRVRGTVANPSLQGRVELVRGRFDFAGRKFELADGSHIELIGGGDIDPVLNVRAVYSTSSLNAEIAISGRASNPQIKLSSNPEMPQDEIISRVLFGDSTQNLSAFEAAQLGAAVASLSSSGGGGLDVLGTLRNAFSLDRLTVGTRDEVGEDDDEGGGPVIRGGKYLTKNIYVEFGSATEEADATSASVDIDITDNLSVGTEATSTGNQKFKVEYKLDY